jgi:hypothetical protein
MAPIMVAAESSDKPREAMPALSDSTSQDGNCHFWLKLRKRLLIAGDLASTGMSSKCRGSADLPFRS